MMTIDYLIGFLPCESETEGSTEQIKELVRKSVCEELSKNGIKCPKEK